MVVFEGHVRRGAVHCGAPAIALLRDPCSFSYVSPSSLPPSLRDRCRRGPSLTKLLMMGGVGWLAGAKIHSGRAMKKIQLVHKSEQKKLYTQYYNDVYKLQQSNAELEEYIQQLSDAIQSVDKEAALEQIQRDYDEFSQPDIDGDDRISRAEFNMYIKDYLSNYPNLEPEDYPRFDEFDHDGDGFISFKEYAEQMALIVQKAEKKTKSF